MRIERRLEELGLRLPPEPQPPPGVAMPFRWVRLHGQLAYVSGHVPQAPNGAFLPAGRVGAEVSERQAHDAARLATHAILGNLQRSIGDLDRITAWLSVSGQVAVCSGFTRTTQVMNGCSDLLLQVFGPDIGSHARTAIGVAELPLGMPVVISAVLAVGEIAPP